MQRCARVIVKMTAKPLKKREKCHLRGHFSGTPFVVYHSDRSQKFVAVKEMEERSTTMLPTHFVNDARLFNEDPFAFIRQQFGRSMGEYANTDYPVDVYEDDAAVHVEAELPGFANDQVEVTLEQGVLTIHAKRQATKQPEGTTTHVSQRRTYEVTRRFTMPSTLDENSVDAKMENGVLHLTLHKREEVKPRRIEVK